MKFRRNVCKRGRRLSAVEIGDLLAADPELCGRHAALCAAGFAADPTAKVRRRADGYYSLRVVWRRRGDGGSIVTETRLYEAVEFGEALA